MALRGPLGTIEESGLSDAQISGTTSLQSSQSLDNVEAKRGVDPAESARHEDGIHDPRIQEENAEEEDFVYEESTHHTPPSSGEGEEDEEDFRYRVSPMVETAPQTDSPPAVSLANSTQISAAQLASILAAAGTGNILSFQRQFEAIIAQTTLTSFTLANEASPRTGFTALHVASSKGHLDIVKWLIEDCGAMVDLEDKENETALHKAALHGHLYVVRYLLSIPDGKSNVHAQDNDGWTPLHNACSEASGYLDIVKWLCEHAGAADDIPPQDAGALSVRGVNLRSSNGWTPLMNAASKGHLPIVAYLLAKQSADPLIRNKWGETAYDIAAAVFEIWICEILQKAEAERWTDNNYNTLAVHTTVPVLIHENQRLDTRLKTLAVSRGYAKFSASGLGRRGRRSPFELRLPPGNGESNGRKDIPAWRSDVQLPLRDDPFQIPKPKANKDYVAREGTERSHFWLSDWTLDTTHPGVDVAEGWQYARSFDVPDDQWVSEMPIALERISTRYNALSPNAPGTSAQPQHTWVRRRRWVRVMRRRIDIPPLPFMGPDGGMYVIDENGMLVPRQDEVYNPEGGQELGPVSRSYLTFTDDYVARARYLAGPVRDNETDGTGNLLEVRKSIIKLERAVLELRAGMLGDEDAERKIQAEVLLNAYSRQLEQRRSLVGSSRLFTIADENIDDNDEEEEEDESSDENFHYPVTSETGRPPSIVSHASDYFSRAPTLVNFSTDLTPYLTQAPDFRVPTHESPQNMSAFRPIPIPHAIDVHWERDETVTVCRGCSRRFTFLFRKHCRRCGKIFCDRCSSHRAVIDPENVVRGPTVYDASSSSSSSMHRVCTACHEILSGNVPGKFQALHTASMERIEVSPNRLAVPNSPREVNSQISDLSDCPVCGQNLAKLGGPEAQETHVRACLEGPKDSSALHQPVKYIVYRLPAESALIGVECNICLEEFVKDSRIARLSCLCSFHSSCLSAWLKRGKSCPSHPR